MEYIPYSQQDINEDDIQAVISVLRQDFITQGPTISAFEEAIASYCGAKHAVAVSSCTAALHCVCAALGVSSEDIIWTSPISFVASANCARYLGATVNFVDINPQNGLIDIDALGKKLQEAEKTSKLPKLLIIVHYAGHACDMKHIHSLVEPYNILIVEDAAHALGGQYSGDFIGCCRYSDAAVFSFHPVKSLTTGEGGMVVSNNAELASKVAMFRSHGITRGPSLLQSESPAPWYYEMQLLGYHYRMTDIQAALGISQLKRLDTFISKRKEHAKRYHKLLSELPLILFPQNEESAWHLYPIQIEEVRRKQHIFEQLRAANIGVNVHYIPIHIQPYYRTIGFSHGDFPQAELFYNRVISLPLFPGLREEQQDYIANTLRALLT